MRRISNESHDWDSTPTYSRFQHPGRVFLAAMSRVRVLLIFGWCLVLGGTTGLGALPPVRILPLGDSMTSGGCCTGVDGGYRARLFNLLLADGFNVDFVG